MRDSTDLDRRWVRTGVLLIGGGLVDLLLWAAFA